MKDLVTASDPDTELCTLGGAAHDYRPYTYLSCNRPRTSWRCVWCHAVACGDYGKADPCWLPYHHSIAHRSRAGVTWPIGGMRPG